MGRPSVTIEPRFQGLRDIALGGYVGGLLAGGRTAEVRLFRPPPVGRSLRIEDREDGATALMEDGNAVALARPVDLEMDVPAPVAVGESVAASRSYPGFRFHFVPMCFVCGPARQAGDGLRIFPAPVPGRALVAAPWVPDASLAGPDGAVAPEFLWAAVDCPSIWALIHRAPRDSRERVVTARLALRPVAPARVGEPCVVTGWDLGTEGRFRIAGAAVHSAEGRLLAVARHTLAPTDWGVPLGLDAWNPPSQG